MTKIFDHAIEWLISLIKNLVGEYGLKKVLKILLPLIAIVGLVFIVYVYRYKHANYNVIIKTQYARIGTLSNVELIDNPEPILRFIGKSSSQVNNLNAPLECNKYNDAYCVKVESRQDAKILMEKLSLLTASDCEVIARKDMLGENVNELQLIFKTISENNIIASVKTLNACVDYGCCSTVQIMPNRNFYQDNCIRLKVSSFKASCRYALFTTNLLRPLDFNIRNGNIKYITFADKQGDDDYSTTYSAKSSINIIGEDKNELKELFAAHGLATIAGKKMQLADIAIDCDGNILFTITGEFSPASFLDIKGNIVYDLQVFGSIYSGIYKYTDMFNKYYNAL